MCQDHVPERKYQAFSPSLFDSSVCAEHRKISVTGTFVTGFHIRLGGLFSACKERNCVLHWGRRFESLLPQQQRVLMIIQEGADVQLEQALNSFDPGIRRAALADLLSRTPDAPPGRGIANMHCHTFFSFNAYGYSPTGLGWLARQEGIDLMGIVDFDVLDAVSEFLDACDAAAVRGSAGIETRVYVPEFADREINSPGEPGVLYHMAIGFTRTDVPPAAQAIVDELRGKSAARNCALIARVNAYLDPVTIDYEQDVLPLTPSSNATERHIVVAYIDAAERMTGDAAAF